MYLVQYLFHQKNHKFRKFVNWTGKASPCFLPSITPVALCTMQQITFRGHVDPRWKKYIGFMFGLETTSCSGPMAQWPNPSAAPEILLSLSASRSSCRSLTWLSHRVARLKLNLRGSGDGHLEAIWMCIKMKGSTQNQWFPPEIKYIIPNLWGHHPNLETHALWRSCLKLLSWSFGRDWVTVWQ